MKNLFVVILSAMLAVVMVLAPFAAAADRVAPDDEGDIPDLYPVAGRVVSVDTENDELVFVDCDGYRWDFWTAGDFIVGEVVAALVWTNDTPHIDDDDIVIALYHAGEF